MRKTWLAVPAAACLAVTGIAAAAAPGGAASPALAGRVRPAAAAGTAGTIYACVSSAQLFTSVNVTAPPACPPGSYPVSWAGTVPGPSPSPSPSSSPATAPPSPSATPTTPPPGGTGQVTLTGSSPALALDNSGAILHDGNPVTAQPSDAGARSQQWLAENKGSYVLLHPDSDPAMCLDEIMSTGKADIWGCGGGPNQQWVPQPDGTLQAAAATSNAGHPMVLTDPGGGAQLTVAAAGGPGQKWALPSGNPSPSPSPTGTGTCPSAAWAWSTTDPNGGHDFPPYYLYNNSWNGGEAGPQDMCANSGSDWMVTSTQPDLASDPGSVKTYPEVQRNYPNVPMTQFSQITSSYAESMPLSLPRLDAEAAYDIWLGNTSVATTEIMFWVDNAGQSPGGTLEASGISFGGRTWDLWSGGGTYFAWVLTGITPGSYSGQPSGTADLLAGMKWLVNHGDFAFDSNHLMRQVNYGWEICSTGNQPGAFRVSSYSLTSS